MQHPIPHHTLHIDLELVRYAANLFDSPCLADAVVGAGQAARCAGSVGVRVPKSGLWVAALAARWEADAELLLDFFPGHALENGTDHDEYTLLFSVGVARIASARLALGA